MKLFNNLEYTERTVSVANIEVNNEPRIIAKKYYKKAQNMQS